MMFEMIPHRFRLDAFIKKTERIRERWFAEPSGFRCPFLNLLQVYFEYFGRKICNE